MADILLSPALYWALAVGAAGFAALAAFGKRRALLPAFLSGACTAAAVLTALAIGRTLQESLTAALAVAAVSLLGLTRREGGGGT